MEQDLQAIDWTLECLEDKQVRRFKSRVVWPVINLLYRQRYKTNFLHYKNLGEEFEIEEYLVTPDGDKLMKVWLEADCEADYGTTAADTDIVGSATIGMEERLVDAEEFLIPPECDLEIWKTTSYNLDAYSETVCVDLCYRIVNPEHGELEDLDEHQMEALKYLGGDTEDQVLTKLDCLDIANIFIALGVPERFIDKRMHRFAL